jgi:hypothetical protein
MSVSPSGVHLERSFITQRRGMALLAALFPVAFLFSSFVLHRTAFQASISAYYWTLDPERNIFVGVLCAVAVFLILYRGYSWREDRILDLAGSSAAGIAFFPIDRVGGCAASGLSAHGVFAVVFFACIAYVCVFMSENSLRQIQDAVRRAKFRAAYRWCSGVMIASIVVAIASRFLPSGLVQTLCEHGAVFWLEAAAIWAFSAFWYLKTRELDPTASWIPLWRKRAESA